MAEKLRFQQIFAQRCAMDGTERLVRTRTQLVDGLRHEFLSRAAFASHEHSSLRGGHLSNRIQYSSHRGRRTDDVHGTAFIGRTVLFRTIPQDFHAAFKHHL